MIHHHLLQPNHQHPVIPPQPLPLLPQPLPHIREVVVMEARRKMPLTNCPTFVIFNISSCSNINNSSIKLKGKPLLHVPPQPVLLLALHHPLHLLLLLLLLLRLLKNLLLILLPLIFLLMLKKKLVLLLLPPLPLLLLLLLNIH